MDISKVIETVKEIPTTTKLKCWVFEINNKYYHVAECSGYRIPDHTSIWTSSRSGKRTCKDPIFTVEIKNYKECITKFFETINQ